MSLYDLPKDMLIKLITTIEKDTIKECNEKMYDKVQSLANTRDIKCGGYNCIEYMIFKKDMIADIDGVVCDCDWLWYCKDHWKNCFSIVPKEEGNYDNCIVCVSCENRDNTKHVRLLKNHIPYNLNKA
jgi:hypothetical protein